MLAALAALTLLAPHAATASDEPGTATTTTTTMWCPTGAIPYVAEADWTGYQCMDVYRPTGEGPFPAVVFVHGGAWRGGSFRSASGWKYDAAALAQQGYVTFNIEYDRNSVARNTGYLQEPLDVRHAIEHIRAEAATYAVDPERVGLIGDSAGGHLVLLAAYRDLDLAGVVSWSGPGDLAELTRAFGCGASTCADEPSLQWVARAAQEFEGRCLADARLALASGWTKCRDNRYATTAPITWVDGADPPTLLAAATEDPLIPFSLHLTLRDAAQRAGIDVREVVVPGGVHARAMREAEGDPPGLWAAETVPFLDDCVKNPPCAATGTGTARTSNTPSSGAQTAGIDT